MFLPNDKNSRCIEDMIASELPVDCAVAFLGEKALEMILSKKRKVRLVCNLLTGGTNPHVVERLMKSEVCDIKMHNTLHAKVYIADKKAIVTSANMSANGLGYEDDECLSWIEAGYLVKGSRQLDSIKTWFDTIWLNASVISNEDIQKAKERWGVRRCNRPPQQKQKIGVLQAALAYPEQFKDKKIFIFIWREQLSTEAKKLLKDYREEMKTTLFAYEDWGTIEDHTKIIDLYHPTDRSKRSRSGGLFQSIMTPYPNTTCLTFCKKINEIDGFRMLSYDKKMLESHAEKLWALRDKYHNKAIPLEEALEIFRD